MIYYSMLQRLDYDQEGRKAEDIRRGFDNELMTSQWRTPLNDKPYEPDPDRPAGAPAWWVSDEEASQSFLKEMGVNL